MIGSSVLASLLLAALAVPVAGVLWMGVSVAVVAVATSMLGGG